MILQGKSIDIDDYDQMLNNCCSLDETLFREIEIIKKLSTRIQFKIIYVYSKTLTLYFYIKEKVR